MSEKVMTEEELEKYIVEYHKCFQMIVDPIKSEFNNALLQPNIGGFYYCAMQISPDNNKPTYMTLPWDKTMSKGVTKIYIN